MKLIIRRNVYERCLPQFIRYIETSMLIQSGDIQCNVRIPVRRDLLDTTLCDKVSQ